MEKIDVLLLHQPLETPRGCFHNTHPIGLFSMANLLRRNGINCQILNIAVEKSLDRNFSVVEYINKTSPRVIGIGLHWYVHLFNVIELARKIRENSSVKIVLGGFTASIFSRDILTDYSFIDAVIDGEGEIPMLSFVRKVLKEETDFSDVANLVFRNNRGHIERSNKQFQATSEELNSYDYSDICALKNHKSYFNLAVSSPIATYYPMPNKINSIVQLVTGRGCGNNCFNCGASSQALSTTNFKPCVRYRDHKVVIKEINSFVELGYRNFAIVYNPEDDYSYYLRLFEIIRKEKIRIGVSFDSWFIPPRQFIDEFSNTFDLNYSALGLTIESGSLQMRRQFNKFSVTNEQIMDLLVYLDRKGIFTNVHFTIGLPNETKADIQETVNLMLKMRKKNNHVIINTIPIEPGSPLSVYPERFNVKIFRKTLLDYLEFSKDMANIKYPRHPMGYETSQFSETDLQKIKLDVFYQCYLNNNYLGIFLKANRDRRRLIPKLFCAVGVVLRSPYIFYKYTPGALC